MRQRFLHEVEIKSGFQSKNILFPIRQILTADSERFSIAFHWFSVRCVTTRRTAAKETSADVANSYKHVFGRDGIN